MKTAIKSTVGVLAAESLETCLQRAEKYEIPVAQNTDPEDLHQMRVQLRRLRTAMQVFAPSLQLPKGAREAQVAQVARKLGKQRDLDVIGMTLQTQFAPDLPDHERAMLDTVLQRLAKRQKKAHRRVKKELRGKRYKTLKSALYKWTADPDCNATARLSLDAVLPDLMLPLVSQLWLHPGWLLGTKVTRGTFKPDTGLSVESVDALMIDRNNTLHSLRKQVKRVRYQLKFVSEHYGDRLTADLERFADLQDVLGALQDSLILEDFLAATRSDWSSQLPTLKSLLEDSRHRAWQQWQAHQAHFLTTKNRNALRQILLTPGAAATQSQTQATATKAAKSSATAPASPKTQASTTRKSRSKTTPSRKSDTPKKSPKPDNNGSTAADN
ncbi:CHAD domain-containing protein [Halomicronema sp. CCY15110]|uniref:CHAD domain-containing protein n=1 Tax=Halomicronema sp. CCY15110 TaxID=2767773 RepID=UPI00194DF32B|nr:CHAD domain-containing protein [Halomicronema sp. CCY15110]